MGGRRGNGEGSIYHDHLTADGWGGEPRLWATVLGYSDPPSQRAWTWGLRRTGQRRPDLALDRICAGQHSG